MALSWMCKQPALSVFHLCLEGGSELILRSLSGTIFSEVARDTGAVSTENDKAASKASPTARRILPS